MNPYEIITDSQIEALNVARDVLAEIKDACPFNDGDWAKVYAVAGVAEHMIFTVLNTAQSHAGRTMSYEQMHNAALPVKS